MDNSIQHITPLKCLNVLLLWTSFAISDNIILMMMRVISVWA